MVIQYYDILSIKIGVKYIGVCDSINTSAIFTTNSSNFYQNI